MKRGLIIVLSSVILSSLAAYAVVKAVNKETSGHYTTTSLPDGSVRTVNLSLSDYPDFTFAAENSIDAVVYVKVTIRSQERQELYNDPFFRYFFGDEMPQARERVRQGVGSGVIIRPDGYIVTNNHVIAGATELEVTLNDNRTYKAEVIGTDPATDIALIKIDETKLPYLELADSDKLRLGEWVLAIGSPLGEELRSTITAGIVSAKGRSMPNRTGEFKIESFIQTDAAVNPGNSGGALVNKEGKLVGVNTAIISTTVAYAGYSFAVPSNIVAKVISDIIDFGSVKRAKLGVSMSQITSEMAKEMKLSSVDGVYIHEVSPGSAADRAGIKSKGVIVAIDDTPIKTPSGLQEKVNSFRPGDKATITIIRDSKEHVFNIQFLTEEESAVAVADDGTVLFYGASLKAGQKGVEIVSVGNGKVAKAGGENGFTILYVNDQKVKEPKDVIEIAKKSKRSIFIEGITANGRPGYFGFGKDE